jgi:sirohydrochlorin ferrochelatase
VLIAVAHGSRDPRAAATVSELLHAVRDLSPGLDARAAFLDHCAPALGQVLGSLDGAPAVLVPLLLTAAYHAVTDIPAQLAAAAARSAARRSAAGRSAAGRSGQPGPVSCAATLGPHPFLIAALERRLAQAGVAVSDPAARAATGVVLAAAGSSDPAANAAVAALAARWEAERGWRAVRPAYASAAAPAPADAVRELRRAGGTGRGGGGGEPGPVVVATYLLSPGYFADKIAAAAVGAGASAVSPVLGAGPEVARLILDRYAEQAPACGFAAGPQAIVTSPLGICFAGGNRGGTDVRRAIRPPNNLTR